jgi:hypothetical protein
LPADQIAQLAAFGKQGFIDGLSRGLLVAAEVVAVDDARLNQ